ncbi:hypothetical protein Tco_0833567 [Tanacetum coccineum]
MIGFSAHMEDDVDMSTLTIEQYIALIPDDIKPGIVNPKISDDVEFEINANFMRELRHKVFTGTDDEDAYEHVCTKLEEIRNFKQERDETLYHAWERYNDLLYQCTLHDLNSKQKIHIFYTGLDISTRKILDSNGFIPLMTPTQALKSIQVMADHLHNWYDESTTRERINIVLENVDTIHESFKGEHLTKEKIKGDMGVGWDITSKDVERQRQYLTPTMHTLPNLEPVGQPYIPLGPVHDRDKIVREEEQDYDIPLNDSVMQPLTP